MPFEDLSYFQEERFKKNLALYEQMAINGQSVYLEADELTDIAEYYMVHSETDKAMQCISYALELHPDSIDPLIFLARQKMFEGNLEEAKNIRDSISDPNDRELAFLNAELMLREQDIKGAMDYLKERNGMEEDSAMFNYDVATLFLDYGLLEETAYWGQKALDLEPENERFLHLKADLLIADKQYEEAATLLDKILDSNPYNVCAWHSLGEACFMKEDYQRALETADFALAIDENDAQAAMIKANCLLQLQRYHEAHKYYQLYLRIFKTNELPYLFDGICLMATGHYEEALTQLLTAEELAQGYSPEQKHIYTNIAGAYSRMNQPNMAFRYLDKLRELMPEENVTLYEGHVLLENKKITEGIEVLQTYLEEQNHSMESHFQVGLSYMENEMYGKAAEEFHYIRQNSLPTDEFHMRTHAGLAYCALMENRQEDFLEHLKVACEIMPESLKENVGQYIPREVAPKDYYNYVLSQNKFPLE